MSRFDDCLEQDLSHIADRATPSPTAWEAIQTRIAERAHEPEIVMLDENRLETTRSKRGWMLSAAAALVIVVGGAFALTRLGDDESQLVTGTETPVTVAGTTAPVAGPSGEPSVSESLYGVWLTPDNANHLSFNEDDTWSFSHADDPVDNSQNRGFGPFTFDGELLSLFTDPASKNCSFNSGVFDTEITGTYQAVITPEGNLELTDVDDRCIKRKIEFRGKLSNPDALHQTGILVPYSP